MSEPKQGQRLVFYGRRKGKALTTARQAVTDTLLPRLKIDPPSGGSMIDVGGLFPHKPKEIWLEIGFGAGEHLAAQAERNPDVGIIGGEVFLNGVASLIRYVDENHLSNVRVFNDDVRVLLPALPDKSLARVFVLFPDPWPKVRHAKRRFIGPKNLNQLARLMPEGAELRVASDHPVYIQWVMEQVPPHPCFQWDVKGPEDWAKAPADHVETRYQRKAAREGRKPAFFRFFRTSKPSP